MSLGNGYTPPPDGVDANATFQIHHEDDVSDAAPVSASASQSDLGSIPAEPTPSSAALVRRSSRADELLRRPPAPFGFGADGEPPDGMATEQQLEGFRELRTRLLAMGAALSLRRFTTLVVPITSGAGGSFVARNLAAAFALQEGNAALLVDCNMKHPTQHETFRTPRAGLFDFLEDPGGHFDSLLRLTSIPMLHVIPAGRPRSKCQEYFSSTPMRALIEAMRRSEYFVFLDGPPVKGSPDARILSEHVDFVILVVAYGSATGAEIAQAAAIFAPAKFAGVVFNERG